MSCAAPTILYIHGFNSSPASAKAQQLRRAMHGLGLAAHLQVPALHHHPRQAIAQLEVAIADLGRPLLVGSSLGGYYATFLAERHRLKALLLNPAVAPHRLLAGDYLGPQINPYSGERWLLTEDYARALAELEVPPPCDPDRYRVWLQSGDQTLDYRLAASYYQGCTLQIQPGGDHRFEGFAERIPELLAFAGFAAERWRDFNFSDL